MKCKAIVTTSPNNFSMDTVNVKDIDQGLEVKVAYSSICGTDHQVFSGDLIYYKNNVAKYPIVTGHEWCGVYQNQPVVGVCILGCGNCNLCNKKVPIHCSSRQEVGVVNKNGAHAEYVFVPSESLIPIPKVSPEYALVEPLAVCIHAIDRMDLSYSDHILVSGYGCIGKLCSKILGLFGYRYKIYDPFYPEYAQKLQYDFDVLIECSGSHESLSECMHLRGLSVLLFGFEYNKISPADIVSNEMSIVGTLGSNIDDFKKSVDVIEHINIDFYTLLPLSEYRRGIEMSKQGTKIIFDNTK